ncbi:hypothetical protein GPEL0_01r0671 [Geoanaerobacter pelophilus]|uniref:Transposase n=1 Tax=Geoanaerobacter pelophilus TaxID=60036 RepID=A0ABQ0MF04_9BACT|nr:hypothetical protein GPEL0_01r0671 [Geoanaerobacter pelophilus]
MEEKWRKYHERKNSGILTAKGIRFPQNRLLTMEKREPA